MKSQGNGGLAALVFSQVLRDSSLRVLYVTIICSRLTFNYDLPDRTNKCTIDLRMWYSLLPLLRRESIIKLKHESSKTYSIDCIVITFDFVYMLYCPPRYSVLWIFCVH
jgi:hypothetical protein